MDNKIRVYKTTELDLDMTVKALCENELGILLLQSDGADVDMYSLLVDKCTFKDRQGMYVNNTHITYHLFNLKYHKPHDNECDFVEARTNAIHNVFTRWTDKGYNKHHSKNPYGCKAFIKYLDELNWHEADYMLLMVD